MSVARTSSLTLSAAASLVSFGAFAAPVLARAQNAETNQRADMFGCLDADGDDAVTREEMEQGRGAAKEARDARQSQNPGPRGGKPGAGARAAFQEADGDSDGARSRSALLAQHESRIDQMIARLDVGEDGLLNPEELREGFGKSRRAARRNLTEMRGLPRASFPNPLFASEMTPRYRRQYPEKQVSPAATLVRAVAPITTSVLRAPNAPILSRPSRGIPAVCFTF